MKYGGGLLELLFPQGTVCPLCGNRKARLEKASFCRKCLSRLMKIGEHRCLRCGKELLERGEAACLTGTNGGKQDCRECEAFNGSFTRARAVGYYTGFLQEAIYQYKFVGRQSLAPALAELMATEIYRHPFYWQIQAVVPVPLHRRKLEERGFNQSELLAKEVAKLLDLPLVKGLRRVRDTGTQSKLSRGERLGNVRGAFHPAQEQDGGSFRQLTGKKVLLIDDILTTGTTCHEGALALLEGGAGEVLVFTLALGYQKQNG